MSLVTEPTRNLTITKLGPALAADIAGVDLNQPLTSQQVEQLHAAWKEHMVLRFRGQAALTLRNLVDFSRHFGALDKRPTVSYEMSAEHNALPDEITVISNIRSGGKPLGALGDGEAVWHADMTYNPRPPTGAVLYSKEVPPTGGNTHFANMCAAYESLEPVLKKRVETLSCVHDASRNSAGELRLGYTDNDDPRKTVGATHPLVMEHPQTGRRYLMLGRRRNAYVVGLSLEDSEALLDRLWSHATQPCFSWAQVWTTGDVVMWDNRCTLHKRDSFDPTTRRLMFRTQISADR